MKNTIFCRVALKGLTTLWEKGEGNSSATGVAPANVSSEQPLQGNKAAGIASNQSVVISVGKDNTLSPDRQDGAGNEGRGKAKLCYAGTEVASAMALTIAGASLQPRMYFLPSLRVTGKQSEALP